RFVGRDSLIQWVDISADGRRALCCDHQGFHLWDPANGREMPPPHIPVPGRAGGPALSPDGRKAAVVDNARKNLLLWDLDADRELRNCGAVPESWSVLAFTPDGRSLLYGGPKGEMWTYDVATGKKTAEVEAHRAPVSGFAFVGDGSRVL